MEKKANDINPSQKVSDFQLPSPESGAESFFRHIRPFCRVQKAPKPDESLIPKIGVTKFPSGR